MTPAFDASHFAEIYNNVEKYPNLTDVALELGIAYQTVRNRACILKGLSRRGEDAPKLISRVVVAKERDEAGEQLSARDHANNRAQSLRDEVEQLLTRSRYPVTNPWAIQVNSHVNTVYDRSVGRNVDKESTPRTWFNDTLRVQGVDNPAGRTFIFTGAQNDAQIHEGFWANLRAYANHMDADIVIGPWTYETQWWAENNPTSRAYHPALDDYLCFGQMALGESFVFCGEMNTLPTASRPVSDLKTYTRGKWGVFPHARLQLASVPSTDPHVQAHQVMTTGAVTLPKVIGRKAGIKSIFHHVIGAVIVEFDQDGDVFCRQINADDDGNFYDLDAYVCDGAVCEAPGGVAALVAGDIHLRKLSEENALAVFGHNPLTGARAEGSMVDVLKPEQILLHDIFDNEARNHHHVHDNAYSYEMAFRGRESVLSEVADVAKFLSGLRTSTSRLVVVESNHDIGLERYIREGRYRNDGINIRVGLELELAYLNAREKIATAIDTNQPVPTFSLLEYAVREIAGRGVDHVGWVHDGASYKIGEIQCGNHGFRGANGARGTVSGFASVGEKMTIADKHSPEILDGVYVAGCMNLWHGYNKGPSGWAIACVVQYQNGKRAIVTLQKGKWRA